MSEEREKIVERVRALLSMTVENGCTESEAMVAAEKAAKLMEAYDLTFTDVEDVNDTRIAQQSAPMQSAQNRRHMHPAGLYAAVAIGEFFDCKCWRDQTEIIFFGDRDDVLLAHVTLNMIRVAMDREVDAFMDTSGRFMVEHPATLKASFQRGMGERISSRFGALKCDRWARTRSQGNELVLLKGALVEEEFAKLFPNGLGRANKQKPTGSDWAYAYGVDAGDRQNILTQEVRYDDSPEAREASAHTAAQQRAMQRRRSTPGFFGWLKSATGRLGALWR